ncbi:DUF3397 domain-containing protein [Lentibacillus sp. CBA3610]|uniref:DUF3397 domain-containing protein n=1 Tax=Lentibacillus sp. CBA3610 TaxID=2518176 RepID=UPI00350E5688
MITIPVMITLAVYFVSKNIYGRKWRALHAAVNWTTLLYIINVMIMFKTIVGSAFPGIILAVLLTMFAVIAVVQWKMYTEVVFRKVFKIFWRACFLIFIVLYVLLILIGIILNIV